MNPFDSTIGEIIIKILVLLISKIYTNTFRFSEKLWNEIQKTKCVTDKNTYFLREARIENMQNDSSKIRFGKNNYIRGRIMVYPHGGKVELGG